jgi:AraC family transcriptional regulator
MLRNVASTSRFVYMYTGPAVADYPAGSRLPPRVIEDFEFVWMLRGRARFHAQGREIPLTTNHLLLVPPGLEHSFVWDPRVPSRHGYVHFSRHGLPPRFEVCDLRDPLKGLCSYLLAEDCAVEQTLDFMLGVIQRGALPALAPALQGAVDYLRRHWAHMPLRRIGVAELAAAAHVTRGYLNRLFQNAFHVSAVTGLERIRCARAETLLSRTDLTIDTIARQTGFANVSHFSHRFTAVHGVPPSAYRANPAASVLDHPGVRRLNQHILQSL